MCIRDRASVCKWGESMNVDKSYYVLLVSCCFVCFIIASVCKWGESMNVDKITGKAMSLYTFNMLGRKITERVLLENITLEK